MFFKKDFYCSLRTALRRLLSHFIPLFLVAVNVHRVLLIHDFDRDIILYVVLLCTYIVHGKYYSPLVRNLRLCCRRFGWQLEDFSLGFVLLTDDCFHNFCKNNIPVAQLQIASLVEELLSLRDGKFNWVNLTVIILTLVAVY